VPFTVATFEGIVESEAGRKADATVVRGKNSRSLRLRNLVARVTTRIGRAIPGSR
jgi:hypothetical protein